MLRKVREPVVFRSRDADCLIVRTTRARIIHLQNDYKSLMSRIEAGLHAHHAATALQASSATEGKDITANPGRQNIRPVGIPFAKVNNVHIRRCRLLTKTPHEAIHPHCQLAGDQHSSLDL